MQQPPQTAKQRVILFGFVAAAILISVAVHYSRYTMKKKEEACSGSSNIHIELDDGRVFVGWFMSAYRASTVSLCPDTDKKHPGGGGSSTGQRWISLEDGEELPMKKDWIYLISNMKLVRELSYAEAGIPEMVVPKDVDPEDRAWLDAYKETVEEKLKAYLETHVDAIYGAEPAKEPETEAKDE